MLGKKPSILTYSVTILAFLILVGLTSWWWSLSPLNPTPDTEAARYFWGAFYQIMAYLGGLSGIFIASKWGGWKSRLGKAVLAFSLGLLAQAFGQTVYSYYLFSLHIEAPYPSIGDIGYFGTIPLYILGTLLLARVIGAHLSIRSYRQQLPALLIPIIMLALSYIVFLRDYVFDWSDPLRMFLDFGYPMGQAIYVSLAILTFLLSRKMLGGMMKWPVLLILIALVVQYVADYTFLYEVSKEQWYVGGINDYMYLFSYFMMTIGIAQIGITFKKITSSN